MYNKTVGIYMPTHNRVELLKQAVNSVLAQSYQNFKLVIVDDGSSDDTYQYLSSLTDERISFLHHTSPQGACRSRNEAIAALETELVTGLDDDDKFLPHRLEDLLSAYSDNYAFICSGYYWNYGAHKKALFKNNQQISLSNAFDLNQCSNQILVKRERLLGEGGFDENIPALQDHDLWVRLISKYGPAFRIGKSSYIVNDDHSIERISSLKNKLRAIEIFEEKHGALMKVRNKENFLFYKKKVKGESFTFIDLLKSSRYGLFGLKLRFYFSGYFKGLSSARLNYLQTGDVSKSISQYLLNYLKSFKGIVFSALVFALIWYFLFANH
ncbi:glycosyltransferase [Thalassomonas sp. RHCl1]|uniref:glycosyltransferase n=1 Tax=Thalassomonas sp. RHCl1 TaxID=2995320 RepID=UPI00248CA16E|nr:glycosyltransferase [Thalassomonas sp. RHCl1]